MRGLFIVASDLDSLERKGVASMILDRDEGGFIEKVITLHPMTSANRVVHLSSKHLVHELALPSPSRIRPISWLRFADHLVRATFYARRLITTENVSFIRALDPYYSGLIGYLAARMTRRPFCISIHADYDEMETLSPGACPRIFGSRAAAKRLERFLLARSDMVIAISNYIARVAEKCGAPPERIRVQYHYVDLSRFSRGAEANPNLISVVSRLSREKRIFDLIDIANHLREIRSDFRIVVAGDGAEREALQAMLDAHSLDSYVTLLGRLDRHQVAALRCNSTVCLSLLDGFSLIEAMASGKPVVAYDNEWHSEAVLHGTNGFLADNAKDIARYIHLVMSDATLQKTLGEASRKRADQISSLERRRDVYAELTGTQIKNTGETAA